MYQILQTQGIILSRYSSGDFDSFYQAFTKNYGKIGLFAKSSRKPQAKLTAHLEPGSITSISFVPRINKENYLLTGARQKWKPNFLSSSNFKNRIISQTLTVTRKLTSEEILETDDIASIFYLLENFLKTVFKQEDPKAILLLQNTFILKLLDQAGFCPNFHHCIICNKKVSNKRKIYYDVINGGVVCCKTNSRLLEVTGLNPLKLNNFLLKKSLKEIKRLKINSRTIQEASRITFEHLNYCLE